MKNSEDFQFFVGQSDAPEHQTVAAQRFDRVDSHASHQFLDFVPPRIHQMDQATASCVGIEASYQFRLLCCYAPVAFSALAGSAEMAAES